MEIKKLVWQEKYRPSSVKNVISVHRDKILKQLQDPMSIQNFLFYSRTGGTGKTSMAKAIINDLQCDYLTLNASEERSIDVIRSKVKDFCLSKGNNSNTKKCIWMDEGEKLTKDAMDALKNMIETYASNVFFIFTTNDLSKIPEPMQTRFNLMEFTQPDKNEVIKYIENICISEKMVYDMEGIKKLISIHYPSIRCMVNHLQDLHLGNNSITIENVKQLNNVYNELWEMIISKKYLDVRKRIVEGAVDVQIFNKYIFDVMLEDKLDFLKSAKIIQIVARNEKDFKLGADDKIVFVASIPEMISVL